MDESREIALVEIMGAQLFLYYYKTDHAFSYQMDNDSRARIIAPEDAHIEWQANSVRPEDVWLQGGGLFDLASVHYWRNKIDFDYIDIGANVGMTTILQAIFFRRCGWDTKVYGFEPGPVYDLLVRSVRLNGVGDVVKCIHAAVAEHCGRAQFYVTPAQSPASSLLKGAISRPGVVTSYTIDVDVVAFDEFARELRQAPGLLIKIDAEGADFKVLDGMRRSLAERLICFQIELYPALIDAYADTTKRLLELAREYLLIDIGVQPYALIPSDPGMISAFVAALRERLPMPATDIFALPKRLPNCVDLVMRILEGNRDAAEIARLHGEMRNRDAEIERLTEQYRAILASRSWRLTAPARLLMTWISSTFHVNR